MSIPPRALRFSLAALCLFLAGCGGKPAPAPPVAAGAGATGLSAAAISDDECREFAERLIELAEAGDIPAAAELFDYDALAARSLDGVNLPQRPGQFATQFRSTMSGRTGLITQVHEFLEAGGTYTLLRVHEVEGRKRALLRLLLPAGGVNYHDFVLTKGTDGVVRGADIHIHAVGEFLSETMKRVMLSVAAHENRSILDRLAGREQLFVRHLEDIERMSHAIVDHRWQEALRMFQALPAELRSEKTVLILRYRAAMDSGDDDETLAAIADFRRYHPGDPCVDFLSIDDYIVRKEFSRALDAIQRNADAIGGDVYLDVMRANVLLESGRAEEAAATARKALDDEPTLIAAHWVLVAISLRQKEFADTLQRLKEIDESFVIEWNDLTTDPTYAEFVASPQHQEWLAHLRGKREGS